ncbi:ribonuclease-domain-containing protein [Mollisia scopiformis]|uniref:ribonuclease T1 n=1 Tax=Mollisia scopiformis TaxID=149040 RepID=A0A132B439_MOLSC|nr:ribonuclease-domain-containing protein [Mollisia scopiformis]KUJ06437.1 ribonuclease-domain-containing protein [Mollisia scopiformis]
MVAFNLKALLPLAVLITSALASPVSLSVRQSATTCGDTVYSSDDVSTCANAAYSYYSEDSTAGGSTYPHTYNNYEGFSFPVDGPYLEFPLESGSAYDGGSPGADRCVINTNGDYAGAITHTGASGNDFVGCSGTS